MYKTYISIRDASINKVAKSDTIRNMDINLEIKEQVIGIELAIKLKRLGTGAKQESYFVWHNSYFVWYKGELMPRKDLPSSADENDIFAAFTSQELGWMLPKVAECEGLKLYLGTDKDASDSEWAVWYENSDGTQWKDCYASTSSEAYSRGYVLAILLENSVVPE